MPKYVALPPEVPTFLKQLKRNNNREWFQANKDRYQQEIRDPVLAFIEAFGPWLERISPRFVADPRPVGGSMFRIHRDTRFSRDKSPYKTAIGIQFRHEAARNVHAPGFYLHLEPGNVFVGVGLWHPESDTLRKVRDAIVDDPAAWKRAAWGRKFLSRYHLAGESLRRPPRGYDPDHPMLEDLKRKDYIAVAEVDEDTVYGPRFAGDLARTFGEARGFMRFLAGAVGLAF